MTEDFLHHIWENGLYRQLPLATDGLAGVEVLRCGERNNNAGPDFFNALVRIDGMLMAGNIEIHINSSDWYRHGHHKDRAYDSVMLQLVMNADIEVRRTTGEVVPTALLSFDPELQKNYKMLLGNESWIPCRPFLNRADDGVARQWLESLAVTRTKEKAKRLRELWHLNKRSWEESLYQYLARNFGFSLNGAAFEMVARSLPYKYLLKHRDRLFQLEALLFGQAGMLEPDVFFQCNDVGAEGCKSCSNCSNCRNIDISSRGSDSYFLGLRSEYAFLRRKYNLRPVEKHVWRFLRLRPANFPTVRIAQFAALISKKTSLLSSLLDCRDIASLETLFTVPASGYWDTRYMFNKPSARKIKKPGIFAVRSLIINTVVPVLYLYGIYRQENNYICRAFRFLRELPPENNSVTTGWRSAGITAGDALQSQALLHLKNEFCNYRRCLDCNIGRDIIFKELY